MKDLLNTIEKFWCENMHTQVMWPIHGHYRCSKCLREYSVQYDSYRESPRRVEADAVNVWASPAEFTRAVRDMVGL